MEIDFRSQLLSELTRIIECPYPASLSRLDDLLTRADVVTIQLCIHDLPPCAVTRLATLLCEALPLWAYTSHVLQLLCHSREFTEKLFLQSPELLDALLVKANSSQHDFDDYLTLCVQLLSSPLPESIALPASAQSFFLRVFERATQNPNVSTLQPVYSMLNGACRKLLGLLPSETRQQFDRELCHILSSNGTGQNSMLLLWCFGIVVLAEHPEELGDPQDLNSDYPKPSAGLEKQCTTASGRKLFGSLNGLYKTMNLTYLSVIWASKGDVGVSDAEAIEGIQIAVRTLRFVDIDARAGWPNSSALAKNIFPKLPAKILRAGICPMAQLEALCFYAMIAGANNIPLKLVTQYQRCLDSVKDLADASSLREILLVSLPIFAPQMQDSLFRMLLSNTIDCHTSYPGSCLSENLVTLVDALIVSSSSCAALSSKLLLTLSSSALQEKIWRLVRTDALKPIVGCHTYAVSLHREAIAATIALILNLIISPRSNEPFLPNALSTALIAKQRNLPYIPKDCLHIMATQSKPSISLFQQESTPFTGQHLQDWRNRLKSELEGQNAYQRDSIVRSVAQICQDLEMRCNTIEEPLRREKARSQELEQRVEELGRQISSLESQAADDRFHLDGLEDEKLGLAEERDQISGKLDELRLCFEEANRDAGEALRIAREQFDARELELRSTVLNREEQLHGRDIRIQELNDTVSQMKRSFEHTEEELRALGERYEDLQLRLGNASRQLDDERNAKFRQSEEFLQLKQRSINLEHQLQTTESDLEAISGQLSDLEVSHQELKQSSEDALRDSKIKHKTDLDAAALKADEEYSKLNSKLTDTLQTGRQLEAAHEKTRRELHTLQDKFSALETKTEELDTLCGEQEEELEELRTLRRNVLASMGLATGAPLTIPRSQKGDAVPETPRRTFQVSHEHRRRKSTVDTHELAQPSASANQGFTETAMQNATEMPFASTEHNSQSGSTPKRQKPRLSFKVPTVQTPFSQQPAFASRSSSKKLSPVKRSALRQMSPNRRHTTVGVALAETESQMQVQRPGSTRKRRGSQCDASQEDFDMEDFIAGTPFTPGAFVSGTGKLPEDSDISRTEL